MGSGAIKHAEPAARLRNRLLLVVAALDFREASKFDHLDDGRPLWKYSTLLGRDRTGSAGRLRPGRLPHGAGGR